MEHKLELIADMGVHALILFTILTCFFLFYISKLTERKITDELSHLIDNNIPKLMNKMKEHADPQIQAAMKQIPLNEFKDGFKKPDKYQHLNNDWLKTNLIFANSSLFIIVVGFILMLLFICNKDISVGNIIKTNIITFGLIGVVEYLFFTRVALHYSPSQPSLMITSLFNNLKTYSNN